MALAAAAQAAGVIHDPTALESAATLGLPEGSKWSLEALGRALGRAGLAAGVHPLPSEIACAGPAIALVEGPVPLLVVSRGRRGRRAVIVEVGPHGQQQLVLSPRALASRYGTGALAWLPLAPALPLEPVRAAEGPGSVSPWARTRALVALERSDIAVVLVYALAIGALTLAVPTAAQALVNNVAFGTALQPVLVLTVLLAVGLGFAALLQAFQRVVVEVVQQRLLVRVMTDLARRLPRVDALALERRDGRELANRFFDVFTIQKAVASLLVDGLGLVLQTLIGFALLAFYHPLLLAFDVALAVALVLVIVALGRGAIRSAIEESSAKYQAAAWVEALAARPRLFQSAHGLELAVQRADALAHRYVAARRRHFRRLLAQTVGGMAIQVLASTVLLGLGGALVLDGQLTLGQLVAAELVVSALGAALGRTGKYLEHVYDLVASVEKLAMLVDLPAERVTGERLRGQGPARLHVHDPALAADGGLVVAAGERVGLALDEASATRVAEAVAGYGSSGTMRVELDGVDVRAASLESLRRSVVLVRRSEVIPGSLLDNLRVGDPGLDLERAHALLRAVGLAPTVARLAQGVHEPLSLEGAPLREAELRRLAVARALASSPRLLVLDGVLDGLVGAHDPLLDALFGGAATSTVLVCSRDPLVLARCDRSIAPEGPAT